MGSSMTLSTLAESVKVSRFWMDDFGAKLDTPRPADNADGAVFGICWRPLLNVEDICGVEEGI